MCGHDKYECSNTLVIISVWFLIFYKSTLPAIIASCQAGAGLTSCEKVRCQQSSQHPAHHHLYYFHYPLATSIVNINSLS